MLRLLLVTVVLYYATSAPVLHDPADRPLVRTKRSEEAILYGNHQNFARMKKASFHPIPRPVPIQEDAEETPEAAGEGEQLVSTKTEVVDSPETPEEPTKPEQETEEEKNERIEKLLSSDLDSKEELDNEQEEEKELEKEAVNNEVEEELKKEEENVEQGNKMADDLDMATPEGLPIADPAKITEEYQILDEPTSGNGDEMGGPSLGKIDYRQEYDYEPYYDEKKPYGQDKNPLTSDFFKAYRGKRSPASKASSRDARSAQHVTKAEDMSMGTATNNKLGGRVKRDLDFSSEDLEPYLDDGYYGQEDDFNDYPPFYPEDDMSMDRRADGPRGDWANSELENYLQNPRYDVDPRSYDAPGYLLEEAPVMMGDIDPLERRKLDMLRYLYEQGLGTDDQEVEYPDDVEETWQDLGPAREVAYNTDPYETEEEQLPLPPRKRQYLSFVPGNRKRDSSMFYPAQYGPDGRWSALVMDPEREKKSELAEYERLYELAQALNGPRDDGMDKRFDSYLPASPYEDYWDRRRK